MHLRSIKGKLVFSIGFFIGFSGAILLALISNDFNFAGCKKKSSKLDDSGYLSASIKDKWIARGIKFSSEKKKSDYPTPALSTHHQQIQYEKLLQDSNMVVSPIDLDFENYQLDDDNKTFTLRESDWLKTKVDVLCVVFVKEVKLAQAIEDTWSKRCNNIYFFGHKHEDHNIPIIKLPVNITSSWQMLCETMHYIWKSSNGSLQWTIFIRDNMMVLPENLRYLVAHLDHNKDYYLGHPVIWWGQIYNVAEAGYVLSRGALKKIIDQFNSHEKCSAGGKYWKKEDYYLGKHLAALNIYPSDTRDYKLRGTFHGYPLQTLLWSVAKLGNYFTRAVYPTGSFCCSPRSVSYSINESDKIHTNNYLLYHLYVYNIQSVYGNKFAPTPIPEHEVWKQALKDEFNITNIKFMSPERYYAIWRLKYSIPSQFIHGNYKNISQIINAVLASHKPFNKFDN
ncbi:glycoprotein-N-acetylgalactosamine 3-beta-galactosyltransferase 1-like [Chelonus insularis]|uniref:glycoprotein-N-acetylgalactosamine 3-beta-galactosyltransferase 1-like n=1 Tax=Chelonus insularis TaxID=460826 RepID=UPI00158C1102|nr:glycoprotein-N-acetylgalactosamine 3-beta-galactosyltransferase 1-like [Chelonus insularis]